MKDQVFNYELDMWLEDLKPIKHTHRIDTLFKLIQNYSKNYCERQYLVDLIIVLNKLEYTMQTCTKFHLFIINKLHILLNSEWYKRAESYMSVEKYNERCRLNKLGYEFSIEISKFAKTYSESNYTGEDRKNFAISNSISTLDEDTRRHNSKINNNHIEFKRYNFIVQKIQDILNYTQ